MIQTIYNRVNDHVITKTLTNYTGNITLTDLDSSFLLGTKTGDEAFVSHIINEYGEITKVKSRFLLAADPNFTFWDEGLRIDTTDTHLTVTRVSKGYANVITREVLATIPLHHDDLPTPTFKERDPVFTTTREEETKRIKRQIKSLSTDTTTEYYAEGKKHERNAYLSTMAELGAALAINEKLPDNVFATTTLQRSKRDLKGLRVKEEIKKRAGGSFTKETPKHEYLQKRGYDVSIHPTVHPKPGELPTISYADVKLSSSESHYHTVPIEAYYKDEEGNFIKNGCWLWNEGSTTIIYLLGTTYYEVDINTLRRYVEDNPPTKFNTGKKPGFLWKTGTDYKTGKDNGKYICFIPTHDFIRLASGNYPIPNTVYDRLEQALEEMATTGSMFKITRYCDSDDAHWLLAAFQQNDTIRQYIENLPEKPRRETNYGAIPSELLRGNKGL